MSLKKRFFMQGSLWGVTIATAFCLGGVELGYFSHGPSEGEAIAQGTENSTSGPADGWEVTTSEVDGADAGARSGATPAACCALGAGETLDAAAIVRFKAAGDWCTPHGVPESMCVLCNPALIPEFKAKGDWCAGHNLPESLCPLCNPSVAALGIGRDWCAEHGVPASQCAICRNRSKTSGSEGVTGEALGDRAADLALELVYSPEAGADWRTSEATGLSQRKSINPNCLLHLATVRLASPEIAEEAGLRLESVRSGDWNRTVDCYGEVQFDRTKYALISPRSGGIVKSVEVDLGGEVKQGDILAHVDSIEFGRAKADYLRAWAEFERWTWMSESFERVGTGGGIALREKVEAKASLEAASVEVTIAVQDLMNFGLDADGIERVRLNKDTRTDLPIRAPFDGAVVDLNAVVGERIDAGEPLCSISDLSKVWVVVDVSADDLPMLAVGSPMTFRPDSLYGETFTGALTWISPKIDERTRTAKARMEIDNRDGILRAGQFGRGSILEESLAGAIVAPREAVQWDGCCNVVFVEESRGVYQPRKLRIGSETEQECVVLAGLVPGERVVTTGSYLLKTEILKGNIGAGCCGND